MGDVLASSEARDRLTRHEERVEREDALRDIGWAAFAENRLLHPTSDPVGWDEARRRRASSE